MQTQKLNGARITTWLTHQYACRIDGDAGCSSDRVRGLVDLEKKEMSPEEIFINKVAL